MTASAGTTGTGARPWPQILALVFGAVYLLVGIVGFFVTGFDNFADNSQHEMLLFFMINPLHNVVHIVIGLAGLLLARTLAGARTYGWLLAVGESWDVLNINAADNVLHILTAVVGLVIALAPVRTTAGAARTA